MAFFDAAVSVFEATVLLGSATFCGAVTFPESYLVKERVSLTTLSTDWLGCLLSCKRHPRCVSYNFKKSLGICELNDQGIINNSRNITSKIIVDSSMVFHQIKQLKDKHIPCVDQNPIKKECDCSCAGKNSCTQPTSVSPIYRSCQDIYRKGKRKNGTFYITPKPHLSKFSVYCQMTELTGCSGGGWTLAMKVNGSKTTFGYESEYWTNNRTYQPESGVNLDRSETKLPSYWLLPLTRVCVGMTAHQQTHWVSFDYNASSLYQVISDNKYRATNMTLSAWKSLVTNSSIQVNCTMQGFNTRPQLSSTTARARLGIIGFYSDCKNESSASRIGFGTAGSWYGMVDKNSCGNEARRNSDNGGQSVRAFGYILVK